MDWKPTPDEIDAAGDAILEALIMEIVDRKRYSSPAAQVGDLVIEMSTFVDLEWERVGYLLQPLSASLDVPIVIWSTGRRVVRWDNASVRRIGPPGLRLRSLPYPTDAEIEECKIKELADSMGLIPMIAGGKRTGWGKPLAEGRPFWEATLDVFLAPNLGAWWVTVGDVNHGPYWKEIDALREFRRRA